VQKITVLLRLKLLCTIDTPLTDELRKQIKEAEANICGNTKIEFLFNKASATTSSKRKQKQHCASSSERYSATNSNLPTTKQ
jgi:hypothetical protein